MNTKQLTEPLEARSFNSIMSGTASSIWPSPFLRQYIDIDRNKGPQLSSPIGWANRLALVLIYVWFGFFKVIDQSPAHELVTHLHKATFMHYIPIDIFLPGLGIAECLIGILWLFPKLTKVAFVIFTLHIATTFLPLLFLPSDTWTGFILTLPGQYIVKNVVLIASALSIFFDYRKNKYQNGSLIFN